MPSHCLAPENQLTSGGGSEAIKQLFGCSEGIIEAAGRTVSSCKDVPTLNRGKQQVGNRRGVEHLRKRSLLLGSLNIAFDELLNGNEIAADRLMDFGLLYGRFVDKSSDFASPATVPLEQKILVETVERGEFGLGYVFEYSDFSGRNVLKDSVEQVQLTGEVMIETSLADAAEGVEIMGAGRLETIIPKQLAGCAK